MLETVVCFGAIIFTGIALILIKLPRAWSLTLLGHSAWLDGAVTALSLWMHWGTMTGLMAAAMAGLMCSCATSLARWLFGSIRSGEYTPGVFNIYRG